VIYLHTYIQISEIRPVLTQETQAGTYLTEISLLRSLVASEQQDSRHNVHHTCTQHRPPKHNMSNGELWLKYKSLYGDQELTLI